MTIRNIARTILLGLTLIIAFALSASAAPITFTYTGVGASGHIYVTGGIGTPWVAEFSNANFTITAVGDTTGKTQCSTGPSCNFIEHVSATIEFSNLTICGTPYVDGSCFNPSTDTVPGTFDFVSPTRTFFDDSLDTVGFSLGGNTNVNGQSLYFGPTVTASWDMQSSISAGPGATELWNWEAPTAVLVKNTASICSVSQPSKCIAPGTYGVAFDPDPNTLDFPTEISGTFQATVATTPEPTTLVLVGVGLIGLIGARRRKS